MGNEVTTTKQSELSQSTEFTGSGDLYLPTPSFEEPDFDSAITSSSIDIIHPPSPKYDNDSFDILHEDEQESDVWSSYNKQKFGLNPYPELKNTIHRISKQSKSSSSDWLSVFGTQIIQNGQYKTWKIKIYPRHETVEYMANHNMSPQRPIADIVIGIVDVESIKNEQKKSKYNRYDGGFWKDEYFGYGYYGFNGKKFHKQQRGKVYGQRYRIGDIITVELDRQCNELSFYVNDVSNGLAFRVDEDRDFVLALALCNDNYDIQIC